MGGFRTIAGLWHGPEVTPLMELIWTSPSHDRDGSIHHFIDQTLVVCQSKVVYQNAIMNSGRMNTFLVCF